MVQNTLIDILFNDEKKQINSQLTVADFLTMHTTAKLPFAVALNGTFLPKDAYKNQQIQENDKIEIVSPMQGG